MVPLFFTKNVSDIDIFIKRACELLDEIERILKIIENPIDLPLKNDIGIFENNTVATESAPEN